MVACGFSPQPMSGTMVCNSQGAACCPDGYLCVGRGFPTAGGPSAGICWSQGDLPPEALVGTHDYTPTIANDPACQVTDWLPPGMAWPDAAVPPPSGGGGVLGTGLVDGGLPDKGAGGAGGSIPVAASRMVSCGDAHTCAVIDGQALCWGLNRYGQLGNDQIILRSLVPVPVLGLESGVSAIAAGAFHTCALVNGGVQCWGGNSALPVGVPGLESGVKAICAGYRHSCAVVGGGVQCWGRNTNAVLGDGTTEDHAVPVQVKGITSGATAVSCGESHTCAVVGGGARCWGYNFHGQLGDGTEITRTLDPVQVVGLTSGVSAVGVSMNDTFTCALVRGAAMCWGSNGAAQLGIGSQMDKYAPVQVTGLDKNVTAIAVGSHACAVVSREAVCWGWNEGGQVGDGTATPRKTPVKVVGLPSTPVTAIAAGSYHSCVVNGAEIRCWGRNEDGQLGNNSTLPAYSPVLVQF